MPRPLRRRSGIDRITTEVKKCWRGAADIEKLNHIA